MRLQVSSVVVVRFRLSLAGDKRKLQFTTEAFKMSDPTLACKVVPDVVAEAIGWVASSTDEQVTAHREGVITEIEKLGLEMRKSGACDRCGLVRGWLCIMDWLFLCVGGCACCCSYGTDKYIQQGAGSFRFDYGCGWHRFQRVRFNGSGSSGGSGSLFRRYGRIMIS